MDYDGFCPSGWHPESDDSDYSEDFLCAYIPSTVSTVPDGLPCLDVTDREDTDDEIEELLLADFTRFRKAYTGSKHQMRKLTFAHYLDLLGEAQRVAGGGADDGIDGRW